MNINKILNKIELWHDINNFYSFTELVKLAKNYFNNTVKILFTDNLNPHPAIFVFTFQVISKYNTKTKKFHDSIDIICQGLLAFNTKCQDEFYETMDNNEAILTKYNFNKEFLWLFQQPRYAGKLTKFCLASDMYNIMIDTLCVN